MQEKAKEILNKVLEWWNKFAPKQKTIIIGIAAGVVFTFAIFMYVFTKPQYVVWRTCSTTTEASEVKEILDAASIDNTISDTALVIRVRTTQVSAAELAVAAAGYAPDEWGIDKVTSGGLSKTEADKQREYVVYLEKRLERCFETQAAVKRADVILDMPQETGTLISNKKSSSASITLTLVDSFSSEQAATIARAAATALGNKDTSNIIIVDTNANLLFSGGEENSITGAANSLLQLQTQAEALTATKVKGVLVGTTQLFDMVEISSRLDMDYSYYEKTYHEYLAAEGHDQGLLSHEEISEAENTSGVGGTPGTDSNNETGYLLQNGENTSSSQSDIVRDYLPSENIEKIITNPGVFNYKNSTIAISTITYNVIREQDAKNQGLLDGITWEEYKSLNRAGKVVDVPESVYELVSKATLIPVDNIAIVAKEENRFVDAEGLNVNATDVLSIVLIVVILAILAVVVLRTMTLRREVNEEEELSVETLLQSTPETEIEDIEVETKSETRKMIEKFVDDNPEAAAKLLRNWLNEEWG